MHPSRGVVFGLASSVEKRLVVKRRVEGNRTSDTSTPYERCLACAEDAHVDSRESTWFQTEAAHVQPFLATFALHHWLTLICAMTDAPCAVG